MEAFQATIWHVYCLIYRNYNYLFKMKTTQENRTNDFASKLITASLASATAAFIFYFVIGIF